MPRSVTTSNRTAKINRGASLAYASGYYGLPEMRVSHVSCQVLTSYQRRPNVLGSHVVDQLRLAQFAGQHES